MDWIRFVTFTFHNKSTLVNHQNKKKWWTEEEKIKFDPNNDDRQMGQNGSNKLVNCLLMVIIENEQFGMVKYDGMKLIW